MVKMVPSQSTRLAVIGFSRAYHKVDVGDRQAVLGVQFIFLIVACAIREPF